jgi:hypothetical protein
MVPWIPYGKRYKQDFDALGYSRELEKLNLSYSSAMVQAMTPSERIVYENKKAAVRIRFVNTDVFEHSEFNTAGVMIRLNTGKEYLIGDISTDCSIGEESIISGDEIVTHYRVLCRPNIDPIEEHISKWVYGDYDLGLLRFYVVSFADKITTKLLTTNVGVSGNIISEFEFPGETPIYDVKKHILTWYFTYIAPPV